ncbi:MAG TPA: FAD binding domain-containing protein [Anaerolineales bacterium]|nr:FAD binding domain-containing protein [Anaerolineales bacterium]
MITKYHRPQSLDEALKLLARPNTLPLGGGTLLSHSKTDSVEVVDLQALGLSSIKKTGNNLDIGATATLQQLLEDANCPEAVKTALRLEAPLNLRNAATVAGTIVSCDGRSTFVTALLALDAKLDIQNSGNANRMPASGNQITVPNSPEMNIGGYLPLRPRGLITSISIPANVKVAFDSVSRTPADKPMVCVALTQWTSGRTRLAVGGYAHAPMLAMDGTEAEGIEAAAHNAFHEATDEWASAEYRMDVAATLAKRCLVNLKTR